MKEDKRSLKSRNKIKNAFMSLTLEHSREKLSVSQIAEEAQINRSTFYLHYDDVAAVEDEIESEFGAAVCAEIDKFKISDIYASTYRLFTTVNALLDKTELLKKYILLSANSEKITAKLKQMLTNKVAAAIMHDFPQAGECAATCSAAYAVAGVVESYLVLARNDISQQPQERFLQCISYFTEYIIQSVSKI